VKSASSAQGVSKRPVQIHLAAHQISLADQPCNAPGIPHIQRSPPASFSWLLCALRPLARMKKPQTANLSQSVCLSLPVVLQSTTNANMTSDSDYKAEKKASVTDLQGGGIWEINILTFLAPV